MVTVGFGDIAPGNTFEKVFAVIYMVMGIILYSYIIDNVTNILINMDKQKLQITKIVNEFNELANKNNIQDWLREKTLNYFKVNYNNNVYLKLHPKQLLHQIPFQLKQETLILCYSDIIEKVILFNIDINFTQKLIPHMQYFTLNTSEILYR